MSKQVDPSSKQKAIAVDFDEGIDRKVLKQLQARFMGLNAIRLQRTRESLPARQHVVIDLLPLIFHLNHAALPGYGHANCPAGLSTYSPDKETLALAQRTSRTFRARTESHAKAEIDALFIMGSTGSVAHTGASDVDVWLCHTDQLTPARHQMLRDKADRVERWAQSLGLETHIFLMDAASFRSGRVEEALGGENCGSAQHYLLLDEFYRTSILLAGCAPLWWLVPPDQEADYEHIAQQLIGKRFIKTGEYLDFGPVHAIPPGEFVGAGLWQLLKGIDAPYKSILKLQLTETYSQELPKARPLSLEFKAAVWHGEKNADVLDPYVLLYHRLERYLSAGDPERLELMRRSFYLKTGVRLSRKEVDNTADWRARLVRQMSEDWGWGQRQWQFLDQRSRWRVNEVSSERRVIVNELTHSYRFLSQYARQHQLRAMIRSHDLTLLGRKLYAAFQRKAGKIDLVNPAIAPDLREDSLAFIHSSAQAGFGDAPGWLLFRDLTNVAEAPFHPVLRRSHSLVELLTWCHCNGILTDTTRLNLQQGSTCLTLTELKAIQQTLRQWLPVPIAAPSMSAFDTDSRMLRSLIFVNVGVDPLSHLTDKGMAMLSERSDSLGYSAMRENLVVTLDLVSINSWHEVSAQRFEVGDTLIQCLKNTLATCVGLSRLEKQTVAVHCFSTSRARAIEKRVQELFDAVTKAFFSGTDGHPASLRYVIEMDHRYSVLQFFDVQPRFAVFDSLDQLIEHLGQPQRVNAPIRLDSYALSDEPRLRMILSRPAAQSIQIFFQPQELITDIFVLDEHGSLVRMQVPGRDPRSTLAPLYCLLSNVTERRRLRDAMAPEQNDIDIIFHEIIHEGGEWQVQWVPPPVLPLDVMEVQAIGRSEADGKMVFDVYCDHQEFTSLEYGDRLVPAVAHFIQTRRAPGEGYPVYLTDISLPHDLMPQETLSGLQTVQYLHYKERLERQLNRAITEMRTVRR